MVISVVPIGNSKGIRIPKHVLQKLNIQDKVELQVHKQTLTLKPVHPNPRKGWQEAFSTMHDNKDDQPLVPEMTDNEHFLWEW